MNDSKRHDKREELEQLRQRVRALEQELDPARPVHWQASSYYGLYHATSGMLLGMVGATASLLFNVVGSWLVNQQPLQLIQVYLTFPLGARALSPEFSSNLALVIGCVLYIGTGMLLGIPFQMIMAAVLPRATLWRRLGLATVIGLLVWTINFYLILTWLQPLLFGGNWITDPRILPPWVGAATHLVFAWTMALLYPFGEYVPYRRQTEQQGPSASEVRARTI